MVWLIGFFSTKIFFGCVFTKITLVKLVSETVPFTSGKLNALNSSKSHRVHCHENFYHLVYYSTFHLATV